MLLLLAPPFLFATLATCFFGSLSHRYVTEDFPTKLSKRGRIKLIPLIWYIFQSQWDFASLCAKMPPIILSMLITWALTFKNVFFITWFDLMSLLFVILSLLNIYLICPRKIPWLWATFRLCCWHLIFIVHEYRVESRCGHILQMPLLSSIGSLQLILFQRRTPFLHTYYCNPFAEHLRHEKCVKNHFQLINKKPLCLLCF